MTIVKGIVENDYQTPTILLFEHKLVNKIFITHIRIIFIKSLQDVP